MATATRLKGKSNQPGKALARRTASILSPLRYPGGKKRLAGYIAATIRLNNLHPKLFVEPFAGGASVALQLLNDGLVETIALGEKDSLLAGFWKTVFTDHEWLIEKLCNTEPTLANWDRMDESGDDIDYASFAENHRFQIPEGTHWRDMRAVTKNVGQSPQF